MKKIQDNPEIEMLKEELITEDGELNPECMDELADVFANIPPDHIRLSGRTEWSTKRYTTANEVAAAFAHSAVWLSPYPYPDNLEFVVEQVYLVFKPLEDDGVFSFAELSLCDISKVLEEEIIPLPQVQAWNECKCGDTPDIQFSSRYSGKRDPDHDFIDLGALSRNACNLIRDKRRIDDAFDAKFEKEWKEGNITVDDFQPEDLIKDK